MYNGFHTRSMNLNINLCFIFMLTATKSIVYYKQQNNLIN